MNKKITLTCILDRISLKDSFNVKLYESGVVVSEQKVNSKEPITICTNTSLSPYIIITSLTGACPSVMKIDIDESTPSKIEIRFYTNELKQRVIRVYYNDAYYDFPITKGEITLWEKTQHIQ